MNTQDLRFAGEFLSGGRILLRAAGIEQKAVAARDAKDFQSYVGDARTLKDMREAFRAGAYQQVAELASTITLPEELTQAQRLMIELAKARAGTSRPL